jgi:biotin operon repressor
MQYFIAAAPTGMDEVPGCLRLITPTNTRLSYDVPARQAGFKPTAGPARTARTESPSPHRGRRVSACGWRTLVLPSDRRKVSPGLNRAGSAQSIAERLGQSSSAVWHYLRRAELLGSKVDAQLRRHELKQRVRLIQSRPWHGASTTGSRSGHRLLREPPRGGSLAVRSSYRDAGSHRGVNVREFVRGEDLLFASTYPSGRQLQRIRLPTLQPWSTRSSGCHQIEPTV